MHYLSGNSLTEMRGLRKQVSRGTIAVHGMTRIIWEGGIVSLIGLLGRGKTTPLRMIAGIRSHSARTDTANDCPPGVGSYVIVVTNSIFESVYLSSRIVMSARPGRTVNEIDLPSGYPCTERFRTTGY